MLASTALLLTGCSGGSSPTQDAAGVECAPGGAVSEAITIATADDGTVEITSETPIHSDKVERAVIEDGSGDVVEVDGTINGALTYFNGANGDVIQALPAMPLMNDANIYEGTEWAYDLVRCAVPGQTAAVVVPATEVLGEDVEASGIAGLTAEDALVIVATFSETDLESESATGGEGAGFLDPSELLEKAEGTVLEAPEGFPEVTLADNGEPTITFPEGLTPPDTLEIATLIEGDGETVEDGDRVYVNYRGVIWRTGEEFDSSWSRGEPIDFLTTGVIAGFRDALVGQRVGSQVISVVPPASGYGAEGLEQMGHQGDDVMVFVLDILGTVHE